MPEIKHSTEAIFYYWIFGLTKAFSNGHIWETKEETEEEILKILIQLNSKKSWMASLADFSGVHKTRNLFGNGSSLPMNLILSIGFPVRMRYGSIQSLKGRNRGIFHHLPKWSTDEKNSLFLWVFPVNCHWLSSSYMAKVNLYFARFSSVSLIFLPPMAEGVVHLMHHALLHHLHWACHSHPQNAQNAQCVSGKTGKLLKFQKAWSCRLHPQNVTDRLKMHHIKQNSVAINSQHCSIFSLHPSKKYRLDDKCRKPKPWGKLYHIYII